MGGSSMAAAFACRNVVVSPLHYSTNRRITTGFAASTARFQALTSLHGQRLRSFDCRRRRASKTLVIKAAHHEAHFPPTPPGGSSGAESILDDLSRYIYHQVKRVVSPYVPEGFDPLAWLPDDVHSRVHKSERAAIMFLRELLHLALFYFLFKNVDRFCRWCNWIYKSNVRSADGTERPYETSSFQAAVTPLRFLILLWAGTRLSHVFSHLVKIPIEPFVTAKLRSTGLVVGVTWFFFRLKQLYVDKLVITYKADAPRILAFDKVVGLLMYFIAATSIGEVTGFGLRSLLAVGGFSGVALGLASKEIVSNFFGGAVIFTTRPFAIGDRIKAGQFTGYVQDIGFMQTKILNLDRNPMTIPNQSFINQAVTNYSRADNRLLDGEFQLRVDEIFRVDRITARIVRLLISHPEVETETFRPVCYLDSIGLYDLKLKVKCLIRPTGGAEFFKVQQSILLQIAQVIAAEGSWVGSNPPPELPADTSELAVERLELPAGAFDAT